MTLFGSPNFTGRTAETQDGKLKFLRRLTSGSSGTVYIAEYTKTCRQVAVKVISRDTQRAGRSDEEFKMQDHVRDHPNIAQIIAHYPNIQFSYGLHRHFTGDLLVFDLYSGGDLFTAIASLQYGGRQEERIRGTFLQVLSAVEHCHTKGISHRDIKPENILLSEDGSQVFLTDFGFATKEDMVRCRCGSPMYMSWGE
jgi:serine/threonine protein kinase